MAKKNKKKHLEQENEINYKSARIALPIMQDEYTKELERKNILENKVIALLTIQIAVLTIFIPLIPFDTISELFCKGTKFEFVITFLSIFSLIGAIILIGISFGYLISAIKIQVYKKVDIEDLCSETNMKSNNDVVEAGLCIHYKEIIMENSENNNKKSRKFQIALPLIIISFVLLMASTVIMKLL